MRISVAKTFDIPRAIVDNLPVVWRDFGQISRRVMEKNTATMESQGEIVKYEQDGMPQLEVWLEDETIWLTQKQMGELFGCAPQNITYHLKGIYKIGELSEPATCKEI